MPSSRVCAPSWLRRRAHRISAHSLLPAAAGFPGGGPVRRNHQQRTRPQPSRQQRRQCRRPQRSRQQRRQETSVKLHRLPVTAADIGATGAACVGPDAVERTTPATAIANTVRNMCLSLFLWCYFRSDSLHLSTNIRRTYTITKSAVVTIS